MGGHTSLAKAATCLVVEHIITDPAKFEEYRAKIGLMLAKHGGRYLTKGNTQNPRRRGAPVLH